MTPHKSLARAKERSPAAVAAWLKRDDPASARRAKRERGVIYWGDETGSGNQDQIGRIYAPRGRTRETTGIEVGEATGDDGLARAAPRAEAGAAGLMSSA